MSPIPSICVVGSLNTDFVTFTPRCPGPGETLTATSLSIMAGGKGANQAVACGRASFISETEQDVLVSMIGAVGAADPFYQTTMKRMLEDSGVRTKDVDERENSGTGSATIVVEATGENRIMVVPGANHEGMSDVDAILKKIAGKKGAPNVIVMQGEIPRSTVSGLLKHYNRPSSGAYVVFNPAPVYPEGIPLGALAGTAVLLMNETEAIQTARTIPGFPNSAHTEADLNPEVLALNFHSIAKIEIVLITLGAKGVFFSTRTGRRGFVAGVKVREVVDTTAAGDTFVGYFSTTFARFVAADSDLTHFDSQIEEAATNANAAAAVCVQKRGAMQSIPFKYEL